MEINSLLNQLTHGLPLHYTECVPEPVCRFAFERMFPVARQTKHFRLLDDRCIGCGGCAKICTAQVIEMRDKRPVWTASQCEMCLACLHHCPKFAIQYEKSTENHGQFVHP